MRDYELNGINNLNELSEMSRITNAIKYTDSEMTRIYNKMLEFDYLIEKFATTDDDRLAARLNHRQSALLKEYNILSIEFCRSIGKRRDILVKHGNELN